MRTQHKPLDSLDPVAESQVSATPKHSPYQRPKVSFDHHSRSETSTDLSVKSRHGFFSEFELIPSAPLTSTYSIRDLTSPKTNSSKCGVSISSFLPILRWLPYYRRGWFKCDLMAALTVIILQVPQVLAYAQLAGLPPEWGLYASVVPVILYSLFSTSTKVAVGPGAPSAIMLASAVSTVIADHNWDETDAELYQSIAMAFTFVCGVIFLSLGLMRAAFVTVFLSRPVMTGFIMSASFIIMLSQCRALMGLQIGRYSIFYENLIAVITNITTIDWRTSLISLECLILLFIPKWVPSIPKWVPIPLIVMFLNILLSYFFQFESMGVETIGAGITSGFPVPKMPDMSLFGEVFPFALVVTVNDYMSNIVLAKSFEQKTKTAHIEQKNQGQHPMPLAPIDVDSNMEFMAYGVANLIGPFFSSQIISASFSRTALNAEMNGQTRVAGLLRAVLCVMCALFLMPYLAPLPKCVLSAVVITAVYRLMKSGVEEFLFLWSVSKVELFEFLVSVIAPLIIGMEMGIFLAIATSIIVNLLRHTFASVIFLGQLRTNKHVDEANAVQYVDCKSFKEATLVPYISIIEMKAEVSFSNSLRLVDKIRELLANGNKYIVVSLNLTSFIDTTAIREIVLLFGDATGCFICLSQCKPKVVELIRRYQKKCGRKFPPNVKTFISTNDAVRYLERIRGEEVEDTNVSNDGHTHVVPLSPTPKMQPVTAPMSDDLMNL
eukprot:411389_1